MFLQRKLTQLPQKIDPAIQQKGLNIMLRIINQTPLFMLPLLLFLIIMGIHSSKTSTVSLKILLMTPTILSVWSFYSIATTYIINRYIALYWLLSLSLGALIGMFIVQHITLKLDKKNQGLEVPGSWLPLILSLTTFSLQYFIRVISALHPDYTGSIIMLFIELVASMINGIFVGRAIGLLAKIQKRFMRQF